MGKARGQAQPAVGGRKHVAPGGAKRNPGIEGNKNNWSPRQRATGIPWRLAVSLMLLAYDNPLVSVRGICLSVARQGGLPFTFFRNPGFRFAPPGATCFRPQSRATENGRVAG